MQSMHCYLKTANLLSELRLSSLLNSCCFSSNMHDSPGQKTGRRCLSQFKEM